MRGLDYFGLPKDILAVSAGLRVGVASVGETLTLASVASNHLIVVFGGSLPLMWLS